MSGNFGSEASISDRIRGLHAQGHSRSEIAKLVERSYQQVRQVLVEDERRAGRRGQSPTAPRSPAVGMNESIATFAGVHRLDVAADGSVRLPPEVRAVLGARPGGVLISELGDDRLVILSGRAAMEKVSRLMDSLNIDRSRSITDELIAERRAENERDSSDV